ncbi:Dpy-30 motif-domain-containing protein, partial [Globomyces pollinis-pini]
EKQNPQALPLQAYLDQSLIPSLIDGLKLIAKERPPNPVEYLGIFLLKNSKNN